jgi:flagellar hook-basal body complex protein FliE
MTVIGAASPALAAYREALARAEGGASTGPSFADVLQRAVTDAGAAQAAGERATLEALAGGASLQEVVEAVAAAELSLEAVSAVRDRVINAYQEIMRMPI